MNIDKVSKYTEYKWKAHKLDKLVELLSDGHQNCGTIEIRGFGSLTIDKSSGKIELRHNGNAI
jgi:hypothetical protein